MAAETGRATQVARAAGATVGLATMITGMAACAAEFIRVALPGLVVPVHLKVVAAL